MSKKHIIIEAIARTTLDLETLDTISGTLDVTTIFFQCMCQGQLHIGLIINNENGIKPH